MAEEIQEAVQIIRVAYDGIEIAMKVGSGGIAAMQKAIDFLKGMLDYEKSLGKTSMRKLLLKGGDLQVFPDCTASVVSGYENGTGKRFYLSLIRNSSMCRLWGTYDTKGVYSKWKKVCLLYVFQ